MQGASGNISGAILKRFDFCIATRCPPNGLPECLRRMSYAHSPPKSPSGVGPALKPGANTRRDKASNPAGLPEQARPSCSNTIEHLRASTSKAVVRRSGQTTSDNLVSALKRSSMERALSAIAGTMGRAWHQPSLSEPSSRASCSPAYQKAAPLQFTVQCGVHFLPFQVKWFLRPLGGIRTAMQLGWPCPNGLRV